MGWLRLSVAALALSALGGCSSIPDEANPVKWAQGAGDWMGGLFGSSSSDDSAVQPTAPAETPKLSNDERPKTDSHTDQQKVVDALVADRTNAQYTQAEQAREGDETRPLEPEVAQTPAPAPTPAPAQKMAAAEPAPAPAPKPAQPAPAQQAAAEPPLPKPTANAAASNSNANSNSVVAPSARVQLTGDGSQAQTPPPAAPAAAPKMAAAAPAPAPAPAPSQKMAAATPAPAPSSAPRPVGTGNPDELVATTYKQRLAEFNSAGAAPATKTAYASPAPAGQLATADGGVSAQKVTPAQGTGGAHPLGALDQSKAAASFEVAEIVFGEGTSALAGGDTAPLKAVVDIYRDSKGTAKIGIIGHSDSSRLDITPAANGNANRSLAAERAAAVARELEKLGVPASKIYAGATGETAGDYAEVFVSY